MAPRPLYQPQIPHAAPSQPNAPSLAHSTPATTPVTYSGTHLTPSCPSFRRCSLPPRPQRRPAGPREPPPRAHLARTNRTFHLTHAGSILPSPTFSATPTPSRPVLRPLRTPDFLHNVPLAAGQLPQKPRQRRQRSNPEISTRARAPSAPVSPPPYSPQDPAPPPPYTSTHPSSPRPSTLSPLPYPNIRAATLSVPTHIHRLVSPPPSSPSAYTQHEDSPTFDAPSPRTGWHRIRDIRERDFDSVARCSIQ